MLVVYLLITLTLLSLSCSEEENEEFKAACPSLASELEGKYGDLNEIGYDCSKMKQIFNDILKLIGEGKECSAIQKIATDEGYDSVDEYLSDLEKQFKSYMSDCPG